MGSIKEQVSALGLAILFVLLAFLVSLHAGLVGSLDQVGFALGHHFQTAANTRLFTAISSLASPAIASLLALLLVGTVATRDRRRAAWAAALYFGGAALGLAFKLIIQRPRPSHPLLADSGFSFPSGHVLCAVLLSGLVCFLTWELLPDAEQRLLLMLAATGWVILVICDRVYLLDHYLTDTLAAVLLGGSWLAAFGQLWPACSVHPGENHRPYPERK